MTDLVHTQPPPSADFERARESAAVPEPILPVPVLAEPIKADSQQLKDSTAGCDGEARESTTKRPISSEMVERPAIDGQPRGGQKSSVQKARARRRRWRDKNPGYMREYRARKKALVAAAAVGAVVLMLFCGCTVPTPSAATLVTYRIHAKAGLQQDESKRMIHYFDSPEGTWYDVVGAKWTFDEDGWRKR